MLPKIPYSMEKNKSVMIPIGNYNISSNFKPGDIADSYGISARKYPRLTTRKTRELVSEGDEILAMTVFQGEIVTVRDAGYGDAEIFVGDLGISLLPGDHKRWLAVINAKLVVYPDKIYIEKVDGDWVAGALGAIATSGGQKAIFTDNSIVFTPSFKAIQGYGGTLEDNIFSGNIVPKPIILPEGTYMFGKGGYIAPAKYYGMVTVTCENNIITIETEEGAPKLSGTFYCCPFDGGSYIVEDGKVSQDGDRYIVTGTPASEGSDDHAENLRCPLYYIRTSRPFYNVQTSKQISITDENNNVVVRGEVRINTGTAIGLSNTYHNSENEILSGAFTINYLGWQAEDIRQVSSEDVIYFGNAEKKYTVSNVTVEDDQFHITTRNSQVEDFECPIEKKLSIIKYTNCFANFKKGDAVVIKGSTFDSENEYGQKTAVSNDISFIIADKQNDVLYTSADTFTEHTYDANATVTIERRVPDLEFICERDNRLYGVNNAEKTIYVSALGDPTNMYAYEGVSTDSFAVAVGGEGNFTGCCNYGDSVLFLKEDKIYKLTGYTPGDFALYSYNVDGLDTGSERSLVVINEVLYYKGKNGIFAYTGGIPTLISGNFGDMMPLYFDAVAGTDGVSYYIALGNDDDMVRLFCYNTRLNLWTLEEITGDRITDFVRTPTGLYAADDNGRVYKMNALDDASDLEWMVQFVPFYETIEGKKTYSRLLMRAELPRGSYMIIEVRGDDGPWCEAGKIVGANKGIIPIRLPIARCDKFEIRLRGKGEFVLHDILREYHVGSEV